MLIGREICVLGAGIGGLTAALALARRGAVVRLLEQAPALGEVGAGVQISPNAGRVLDALGVDQSAGLVGRAVRLIDGLGGGQVLEMALEGGAVPHRFWHRADLVAALANAARDAGVVVETGRKVEAIAQVHGGWSLRFADGTEEVAALLIGADGLHSRLRPCLNPDGPEPAFTGHVAWRALVRAEGVQVPEAQVYMGAGQHLVRYPLRHGSLVNLVGVETRADWRAEGWDHPGDPDRMRAIFAPLSGARDLLAQVETVRVWGLFRHPVAARWWAPGAVLLGDAAHPTLPFMAQGACMAIEDGWVLAACLAQSADEAEALAQYELMRRARCVRIVETAARNADIYHLGGPLRAPMLLGMKIGGALLPAIPRRRFDWIHRYDPVAQTGG